MVKVKPAVKLKQVLIQCFQDGQSDGEEMATYRTIHKVKEFLRDFEDIVVFLKNSIGNWWDMAVNVL